MLRVVPVLSIRQLNKDSLTIMFYRIQPIFDEKITGIDGVQAEDAIYSLSIWDPLHIGHWNFVKIPDNVIIPIPKVKSKARLTDLMSVYFNGSSFRLTISNKLKLILAEYCSDTIQFIPLKIQHRGKLITEYWLTNVVKFDNDTAVNYPISDVSLEGSRYNEFYKINISSYKEHIAERIKGRDIHIEGYNPIHINKLVFKKNINESLLVINFVRDGGVIYCVSEYLKKTLEDEGCTGIEYLPVEQGKYCHIDF
ncbi:hypothetical protein [Sediminibacterium sp.]|uniref:hypothetical protein n=1 Tax=Sediminibacterium sp. TaxID=1917865 RepID=UPI002718A9C3|nr:hypothetical protein [Sediminibacterium sp.]MDO8995514.1 hypothetical protein [Sediminibacterium sp.]MDP2421498.1 hypothetical protein [Sediminibacterium sp.]